MSENDSIAYYSSPIVHYSCADTAKLIRTALKKAFANTTFSVRSEPGTFAAIRIRWTDGPTTQEVKAAVKPFEGRELDEYGEFRTRVCDFEGKKTHFDADAITCDKKESPEVRAQRQTRELEAFRAYQTERAQKEAILTLLLASPHNAYVYLRLPEGASSQDIHQVVDALQKNGGDPEILETALYQALLLVEATAAETQA